MSWITVTCTDKDIRSTIERFALLPAIRDYIQKPATAFHLHIEHSQAVLTQGSSVIIKNYSLPFSLRHILADILSYDVAAEQQMVQISDTIALDIVRRQLHMQSHHVILSLTEKETELLKFLADSGNEGVDKHVLLQEVWGYHPDAESRTLETHLYRLRQKMQEAGINVIEIISQQGNYLLKTSTGGNS